MKHRKAAIIIQACFRGYVARKQKKVLRVAVQSIQTYVRVHLGFKYLKKYVKSAKVIQAKVRQYFSLHKRKTAKLIQEQMYQAIKAIQARFRGRLVRRKQSLHLKNEELDVHCDDNPTKTKDASASTIQANYRGHRARKEQKNSIAAATKIQAQYRGYRVRTNIKLNNCPKKRLLPQDKVRPGQRVFWLSPSCMGSNMESGFIKSPVTNPDSFFVDWTNGRCTRVLRDAVWIADLSLQGSPTSAKVHSNQAVTTIQSHVRGHLVRKKEGQGRRDAQNRCLAEAVRVHNFVTAPVCLDECQKQESDTTVGLALLVEVEKQTKSLPLNPVPVVCEGLVQPEPLEHCLPMLGQDSLSFSQAILQSKHPPGSKKQVEMQVEAEDTSQGAALHDSELQEQCVPMIELGFSGQLKALIQSENMPKLEPTADFDLPVEFEALLERDTPDEYQPPSGSATPVKCKARVELNSSRLQQVETQAKSPFPVERKPVVVFQPLAHLEQLVCSEAPRGLRPLRESSTAIKCERVVDLKLPLQFEALLKSEPLDDFVPTHGPETQNASESPNESEGAVEIEGLIKQGSLGEVQPYIESKGTSNTKDNREAFENCAEISVQSDFADMCAPTTGEIEDFQAFEMEGTEVCGRTSKPMFLAECEPPMQSECTHGGVTPVKVEASQEQMLVPFILGNALSHATLLFEMEKTEACKTAGMSPLLAGCELRARIAKTLRTCKVASTEAALACQDPVHLEITAEQIASVKPASGRSNAAFPFEMENTEACRTAGKSPLPAGIEPVDRKAKTLCTWKLAGTETTLECHEAVYLETTPEQAASVKPASGRSNAAFPFEMEITEACRTAGKSPLSAGIEPVDRKAKTLCTWKLAATETALECHEAVYLEITPEQAASVKPASGRSNAAFPFEMENTEACRTAGKSPLPTGIEPVDRKAKTLCTWKLAATETALECHEAVYLEITSEQITSVMSPDGRSQAGFPFEMENTEACRTAGKSPLPGGCEPVDRRAKTLCTWKLAATETALECHEAVYLEITSEQITSVMSPDGRSQAGFPCKMENTEACRTAGKSPLPAECELVPRRAKPLSTWKLAPTETALECHDSVYLGSTHERVTSVVSQRLSQSMEMETTEECTRSEESAGVAKWEPPVHCDTTFECQAPVEFETTAEQVMAPFLLEALDGQEALGINDKNILTEVMKKFVNVWALGMQRAAIQRCTLDRLNRGLLDIITHFSDLAVEEATSILNAEPSDLLSNMTAALVHSIKMCVEEWLISQSWGEDMKAELSGGIKELVICTSFKMPRMHTIQGQLEDLLSSHYTDCITQLAHEAKTIQDFYFAGNIIEALEAPAPIILELVDNSSWAAAVAGIDQEGLSQWESNLLHSKKGKEYEEYWRWQSTNRSKMENIITRAKKMATKLGRQWFQEAPLPALTQLTAISQCLCEGIITSVSGYDFSKINQAQVTINDAPGILVAFLAQVFVFDEVSERPREVSATKIQAAFRRHLARLHQQNSSCLRSVEVKPLLNRQDRAQSKSELITEEPVLQQINQSKTSKKQMKQPWASLQQKLHIKNSNHAQKTEKKRPQTIIQVKEAPVVKSKTKLEVNPSVKNAPTEKPWGLFRQKPKPNATCERSENKVLEENVPKEKPSAMPQWKWRRSSKQIFVGPPRASAQLTPEQVTSERLRVTARRRKKRGRLKNRLIQNVFQGMSGFVNTAAPNDEKTTRANASSGLFNLKTMFGRTFRKTAKVGLEAEECSSAAEGKAPLEESHKDCERLEEENSLGPRKENSIKKSFRSERWPRRSRNMSKLLAVTT